MICMYSWQKKVRPALFPLSAFTLLFSILFLQFYLAQAGLVIPKDAGIDNLDLSAFPTITAYLDVRDEQGEFLRGLQPSMARVLEDNSPIQVQSFDELYPGAMFIVALNPGRVFSIRDGEGKTRYDGLFNTFVDWASAHPATATDDLSLLVTDGPEAIHQEDSRQWLAALQSAGTDFRSAIPSLDVLMQAVDLAEGSAVRPGMGKAILYVTPPLEADYSAGLQGLIKRVTADKIRIVVWLIAAADQFDSPGVVQLRDLANGTGGNLFLYSGIEKFPDIEAILSPLRRIYRLTYPSKITTSGTHKLNVQVRMDGVFTGAPPDVATPEQSFDIVVKPPNLMFVSPPQEILRKSLKAGLAPAPEKQVLEVLIEFPDGYTRPISKMTFYVDGAPVAVKKDPPFTQVTWDLTNYLTNGTHRVRVETIDSLGIQSSSIEIPVNLIVKIPPESLLVLVSRNAPLIAGFIIVSCVTALSLALILGGKLKPKDHGMVNGKTRQGRGLSGGTPEAKNLTQPARNQVKKELTIPSHFPAWMNPLHNSQRHFASHAHAFLVQMREVEGVVEVTIPAPIQIMTNEVTLGSDPSRANVVIDDPSIEPLHSRLSRSNVHYRLFDEGTIAGTWVNYTPVSKEGMILEHGDLVHIGRMGFRFLIRNPSRTRKPVITPEDLSP
jgi:hypothetical protein